MHRLRGLPLAVLSIEQRAGVVQQLLRDRDGGVADAAAKLLAHWLAHDCGGDPLALLQLLDVETYTDAALLAVDSLIASDAIRPPGDAPVSGAAASGATAYVRAAAAASGGAAGALMGLRQLGSRPDALLPPHQALMWCARPLQRCASPPDGLHRHAPTAAAAACPSARPPPQARHV